MLNAAEVYIHPLGDYDQAIEMCDQALDLAEASPVEGFDAGLVGVGPIIRYEGTLGCEPV